MKELFFSVHNAMTGEQIDEEIFRIEWPITEHPTWQVESEIAQEIQEEYNTKIKVKIINGPCDRY